MTVEKIVETAVSIFGEMGAEMAIELMAIELMAIDRECLQQT